MKTKKASKDKLFQTALIITVITLAILLGLGCNKQNEKAYKVNNLSGYDLNISTSSKVITLKTSESVFFTSSTYPNFSTLADVKLLIQEIGTSPHKTINVDSYKYYFEVKVSGLADSAEIIINGKYFNESLPFFYGTDNLPGSYNVVVRPDKQDKVFTTICRYGISIELCEGDCNLKGDL